MNANEQTILELRAALEREVAEAQVQAGHDGAQLNEISRINNELVNTQRELAGITESARQDAENLRVSEVRYQRLFESAKDGILILDAETGKIEDVNPYLCQLLGYAPDDFMGKQLWEIGTFRDIAANQDAFRTLQEKEYVRYDDLPLETKNGQKASVEFVSNVYVSGDKQVIQCNIRDISQRKSAEADSALLSAIVQSSEDAIISKTLDGIITTWNAGAQKLYGYTAEEAIGRPVSFLAPANLLDEMQQLLEKIRHGEPVEHYETVRVRKDGSHLDISLSISPLKDAEGRIIGASSIKRDISERKRAEKSLRESEARKAAIFETALDGIISMDDTGCVIEFNPAAEKIFGYTRNEVIGQLLADLIIPPALREQHQRGLAHFLETGKGPLINHRIEVTAMRADGSEFPTELSISPVNLGECTIFTGYLRDISERKQAEDNLQRQVEETTHSNDELARFNRLAVGRELRMVELKQQINRLSEQLGTPPPYKLAFLAASGLPEYDGADKGSGDNGDN